MFEKIGELSVFNLLPLIKLVVFLVSFTLHEIAHGYTALACGDNTAHISGRLSFSPLKHFDFVGSFLVPGILILLRSEAVIGWGKTVPVDFKKFNKKQHLLVASAGVLANISLIIAGFIFFYFTKNLIQEDSSLKMQLFCMTGFMFIPINFILALFNSIPLCPLDGWVFRKGFGEERKNIQELKIDPFKIVFNILIAVLTLKLLSPFLLFFIKTMLF